MSNKKKKKKKKEKRTRSIERSIIPLFLRIYLSSPLRFLQSFPTIFVHHFSLSLSLFFFLLPHPPLSSSSSKISAGLSRRLKGGSRIYLAGNTISSIYFRAACPRVLR